jgi:hypothetical protein
VTPDTKTTISGLIAGVAAAAGIGAHAANVGTVFPLACGMLAAAAVAFLGYFSNKPGSAS